ncbi:MAG: phospholipase D family protein [Kofleriaceae bacterium]
MLSPDSRTVAVELLRPPPGQQLDLAVLTTYSLDLEALLALPLAVLAHADGGVDELLQDPLRLLEALRTAGERVHVFVDATGIAIPRTARPLYAMLEASVHAVRAPNGGAFHPKVWVARFIDDAGAPTLRVAVLSRNLTFDRSWDLALATEAEPTRRNVAASRGLAELVRRLPELAGADISVAVAQSVLAVADELAKTAFPAPENFDSPVWFEALGLADGATRPWKPRSDGSRLLAIAPFANRTALDTLVKLSNGERTLVSRPESLDCLPDDALAAWDTVLVLSELVADESNDGTSQRPSGLHAKAISIEHGWDVTWFVGSANLTAAAFTGRNVEMMASMTAKKSTEGIEKFKEGFATLCAPYRRSPAPIDDAAAAIQEQLEAVRASLLDSALGMACVEGTEGWDLQITGSPTVSPTVTAHAWPVSVSEDLAQPLTDAARWHLPVARLTAFLAIRLEANDAKVDALRFTMKVTVDGMPDGRMAHVLRTLIDSPERFLQFLRALLGGLDAMIDNVVEGSDASGSATWGAGLDGETLLEDLVRVAARDPARLEPVRRLIRDLRSTDEGRKIVPDDLYALWAVVDEALGIEGTP